MEGLIELLIALILINIILTYLFKGNEKVCDCNCKKEYKSNTIKDPCGCERFVDQELGINIKSFNCKEHESK